MARDGELALRRLRADDLPRVLAWRRQPHVRAFWDNDDDPADIGADFVVEHYAPLLEPAEPTIACVIEVAGAPVGYLQLYPWSDDRDGARAMGLAADEGAWGLDLFVGEPTCVGRGIATRAVDLACRYAFEAHGASRVALLTDVANVAAQRAYEKAGFTRVRRALDVDRRGGARIESWLMLRERPR